MKAALMNEYGGPEVVKTVDGVPKPKINDNQVLVEVHAAGVNPFDVKVRAGFARAMGELRFPAILGGDVSGVVAEVGANVLHVKPGDAVYGLAGALSSQGSFAEFAPVSGGQIAKQPAKTTYAEAAALPLAGVSALQAIVETLDVQKGQKVLIHGGAGGIGSIAIQIAKHLGAYVAATASAKHAQFVKSLGADEVLDYHKDKFRDLLHDYDAVFDTVGGETFIDSYKVLRPGGIIVSMAAQANPELDKHHDVTSHGQYTQANTGRLERLAQLVESGAVKVHIDKTFPLSETAEALEYLETGHPKGKVVICAKS